MIKKTWIIMDHPQQLIAAIFVSRYFHKKFGNNSNLIVSKHAYWNNFKFKEYEKEFEKVTWIDRLDYPPPQMKFIDQLSICIHMIPGLYKLRKTVLGLNIKQSDIIVGLSTQQFLENMILSYSKNTIKIGIIPKKVYEEFKKKPSEKYFRYSFASLFIKGLQYIFRMNLVICKYKPIAGKILDGSTMQRFSKPLVKIYDYLFVMENDSTITEVKKFKTTKYNIIFTNYPYSISLRTKVKIKRNSVIFLGEDFMATNNLDHNIHADMVNKCLNYLRIKYKSHNLIYKPHPRWNKELKYLNLSGFEIYKGGEPAEIFFINNKSRIASVYAVISTSIRSAISIGLPSYVFYKIFPFNKFVINEWKNLLGGVPKEAYITNLNNYSHKTYIPKINNNAKNLVAQLDSIVDNLNLSLSNRV